jgi:CrcB protein
VVAGAVVGAPLRYLADLAVQSFHDSAFPWGTFTVNVAGSLVLGSVAAGVAGGAPQWLLTAAGTGFCGSLTTFSTLGYETFRLVEDGALGLAALSVTAGVTVGVAACALGWAATAALI